MTTTIIGVDLENRLETAIEFQKIITEHGCEIRTRIGLHPSMSEVCLNRGIILLEVSGSGEHLIEKLKKHWTVQLMTYE